MSQLPLGRPSPRSVIHIQPRPPRKRRIPTFERSPQPRPLQLSERDVRILEELESHRCLSADHIRQLCFEHTEPGQGTVAGQLCHPSLVRRRLRQLFDHGLIRRLATVDLPTHSVPPVVYAISHRGADALAEVIARPASASPTTDTSYRTLRHRLRIIDFYLTLRRALRGTDYTLTEWQHEESLRLTTPEGKRRAEKFTHPGLKKKPDDPAPASAYFLPDAYFQLRYRQGDSLAFFLEADLSTERHTVWKHRAKVYHVYDQAGLFRRRFGRERFRVLIVTPSDFRRRNNRRDNILAAIRQSIGDSDLFLAATYDELLPDPAKRMPGVLGAIWRPARKVAPLCSILPRVMTSPATPVRLGQATGG